MDILMVPIPLFDKEMSFKACYFRYQKGNNIMHEGRTASALDGAMNSPMLETFMAVGVEPFAMDKPIFVPVSAMMLLGDLARQCPQPYDRIIFLLEGDVTPEEQYIVKIRELKRQRFRFAMFRINNLAGYVPILRECDYLFIDQKSPLAAIDPSMLTSNLPSLKLVATHIDSFDKFYELSGKNFTLFEGRFYRLPLTKGKTQVSPLKINLIRLLNTIQDEDLDFDEIATIIERDTALSVSLLRMVNSPYFGLSGKIKTIGHAIAMLGEDEMRKWATTSVSRLLGSDKPDEITRLSLIRAKFADSLAVHLEMEKYRQSLFLMGLFSVLDVILDVSMNEALEMVHVSDDISNALVSASGPFYPVLNFILSYERSDWKMVSRQLIINDIEVEDIFNAYLDATLWYKSLIEEASK